MALTERQRDVLDIAAHTWRNRAARINTIRERLAVSKTSYYRELVTLIDHPEAVTRLPALMRTLSNARTARRRLHIDPFALL